MYFVLLSSPEMLMHKFMQRGSISLSFCPPKITDDGMVLSIYFH